jgi:uncharacterized membrane protein YczE
MVFGLFLFALGIVVTLKANIGYAPWDVLHVGIANKTGLTIGNISILVGVLIVIIVMLTGEKIGFGTILNMILIGVFIDVILASGVLPTAGNFMLGVITMLAGLFIIAIGSFFYIRAAFGAGPRDSLMVVLTRKTKLPVGVCRSAVELSATVIGWFLGGMAGIGTVISAFAIGFCVQIVFRLFRFDPTKVRHETLGETIKSFKIS